jgi:hypothetical protein
MERAINISQFNSPLFTCKNLRGKGDGFFKQEAGKLITPQIISAFNKKIYK